MLKKTIKSLRVLYSPEYMKTIAYMLQSSEYQIGPYLKWFWRTQDFSKVRNRRELDKTPVARAILSTLNAGVFLEVALGIVLIILSINHTIIVYSWILGVAIIVAYPVIWAHLICLPVSLAKLLIIEPKEKKATTRSKKIFAEFPGIKIAVAGSYGKTSMKELLNSVLSEGKHVAATPANKNVAISHAVFASNLSGKEDMLIVEFGEGGPGDVTRFSDTLKPDIAVITGISPAHLDRYKTIDKAAADIFSVAKYVDHSKVYVNHESAEAVKHLKPDLKTYDRSGALGWEVKDVKSDIKGLKFKLVKGKKSLSLSSSLLGRHQIGPLAFAASLAKELGLSDKEVEEGIKKAKAYEHRMQPYALNGAWIIDDTYNGNLEGIRAGTSLLKELDAKRKIYVTPGLVDQGKETGRIHNEVGRLIAEANPDSVVLMQNSVTKDIVAGLKKSDYKGEIDIRTDPLLYYSNLSSLVANGDVVLMQNDWTDNYA
jgi:UDP-N-acetylmuramyl pentapeptide synthase